MSLPRILVPVGEQRITITSSGALSKEQIEKMVRDAELHAEEDRRRKELVEARNQAEQLIYTTDRTLKDLGDKVTGDEKARIEAAKNELAQASKGEDIQAIRDKMESLSAALHSVTSRMYSQAGG